MDQVLFGSMVSSKEVTAGPSSEELRWRRDEVSRFRSCWLTLKLGLWDPLLLQTSESDEGSQHSACRERAVSCTAAARRRLAGARPYSPDFA